MTTKDKEMSEQSNELFTMDSAKQFLNELGEHVLAVAYPDELAAIMNAARAPLLARIAELEAKLAKARHAHSPVGNMLVSPHGNHKVEINKGLVFGYGSYKIYIETDAKPKDIDAAIRGNE